MPLEENKAAVRNYLEEMIGKGRRELLELTCQRDIIFHDPFGDLRGHEGIWHTVSGFRSAFPDLTYRIKNLVAEGDLVATHTNISGTHTGEFLGTPGSGRSFSIEVMQLFQLTNGKIQEGWAVGDIGTLLEQMGISRPNSGSH